MIKVAVNVIPLKSAHKRRGTGYYTFNLIEHLMVDDSIKVIEFEKIAKLKEVDVIHYPWFDFYFHTLPIRKPFPTVVTIHDVIPLIFPQYYPIGMRGRINFTLQKLALKSCQFIIADSQVSKEDIVNHLKIDGDKIMVIHLAADANFKILSDTKLLYIKRKYLLPDRFLLYVGDANWTKNLPFLIEGLRQLLNSKDFENLKLVLCGDVFLKNVENIDHPEIESLKKVNELIKKYGIENQILKPGQIADEELVAFYNLATLYAQPSLYEGFGLPILQAFACGTPVVSSDRGSLPEVGGEAAIYFDPTNLKQFTHILREVIQNKSLQSKLSKLGFTQAAKFSWEKVVEETKRVYLKAAQKI